MSGSEWKNQETRIAIFDSENEEWQYSIFDNWDEARKAVNAARKEGKAAVFYDGATLPNPPTFSSDLEVTQD